MQNFWMNLYKNPALNQGVDETMDLLHMPAPAFDIGSAFRQNDQVFQPGGRRITEREQNDRQRTIAKQGNDRIKQNAVIYS
jgi:hypothetical protein